jgi:hypothetical protein
MPEMDEQKVREQRILDARMEYEQLLISARTIEQIWWVDVSAFFAVNTLLATVFGLSFATTAQPLNPIFLKVIHVLIPTAGVFFSFAATRVANELTKLMRLTNERGRELEKLLFARMFSELRAYSEKPPWGTILASLLFLLIWVAALWGGWIS